MVFNPTWQIQGIQIECWKKSLDETKAAMNSVLNFLPASWVQHYIPEFLFFRLILISPLSESTHSHSGSPFKQPSLGISCFFQGHPLLMERVFTSYRTVTNGNLQVVLPFYEAQFICSLKKTNADISRHLSRVWNTEIRCNHSFLPTFRNMLQYIHLLIRFKKNSPNSPTH